MICCLLMYRVYLSLMIVLHIWKRRHCFQRSIHSPIISRFSAVVTRLSGYNSTGSFIATAPFSQFDKVDGYNPFDNDAADLKGYEDYADSFIDSGSPDETRAIKQRIDQQMQDRQYLSETGGAGIISSLAMGLIDPINTASMFVLAGAVVRGGKVAATAGRFALANAVGGIASEAALSATGNSDIGRERG